MSNPDFTTWLGVKKLKQEPGLYHAELILQPHHRKSLGWIHGVYTALLDTVMGNAVLSLRESRGWEWGATADIAVQFQRPAETEKITGIGRVQKVGDHLVFVEGDVSDANGVLRCKAQGTWFVSGGAPP
ncbi:MAG: hypothetical protein MAGBODY4_00346 [Candidatus Marinimicrobia bacterium]|nr:hypothetical protein [Candidatus Neomarinimicrobiota bacterium]